MSSKKLVIQIVNFKTKSYLKLCLVSLISDLKTADFIFQINILDNNSGDDLSDLEKSFSIYHFVKFYYSDKNLGFGGGHNLLEGKSNSDYILVLNPDTKLIQKQTIKRLLGRIDEDPTIKVIGPKLINEGGERRAWDHADISGFFNKLIWIITGSPYWRERNEVYEAAWISGAVFLINQTTFEEAGGFDEGFFLYKEEEDLCLRIRKIGGKIIYDPTVKVFHHGGVVAKKGRYMRKSTNYYLDKH